MKKTPKQMVGLAGLGLVAAITTFAAGIPSQDTIAASQTVNTTIQVRVVGSEPNINIKAPSNGGITTHPNVDVNFDYENIEYIYQTLTYTDKDGKKHVFDDFSPLFTDYVADSGILSFDLNSNRYGYGEYILNLDGTGTSGPFSTSVSFDYVPLTMSVEESDSGELIAYFDYDPSTVCSASINIYDNGALMTPPSPITVSKNELSKPYKIPLKQNGQSAKGTYRFETTSYNCTGSTDPLYKPYITDFNYENIYVPDTGSLLQKLNISKADYLVTGLMLFFSFAILAIFFVLKKRNYATIRTRRTRTTSKNTKKAPSSRKPTRSATRATTTTNRSAAKTTHKTAAKSSKRRK